MIKTISWSGYFQRVCLLSVCFFEKRLNKKLVLTQKWIVGFSLSVYGI